MNLTPRNPLSEIGEIFDNFYSPITRYDTKDTFFSPKIDIRENKNNYEIMADLPGVDKKDISVTLDNGMLTIKASTQDEKTEKKDGKVIRKERRSGQYMRSFDLGTDVKESDISATFKNGVLTLYAPKVKESSMPTCKTIDIH